MFSYSARQVAGFNIAQSIQKQGDEIKFIYTRSGVSTQNVKSLNIFAEGNILFTMGEYSRNMTAGETGLDHTFSEYYVNTPIIFKVTSTYAIKYCMAPINMENDWNREIQILQPGSDITKPKDSCIFLLSGEGSISGVTMKSVSYRLLPNNTTFTAHTVSKVLIGTIC